MSRAAVLLVFLLPAQAASPWALPDCSPSACHMGPGGESCCPVGECSMQECGKPDADAFFAPPISLAPHVCAELPGPAPSGRLTFEKAVARPAPSPEILDPPPRG